MRNNFDRPLCSLEWTLKYNINLGLWIQQLTHYQGRCVIQFYQWYNLIYGIRSSDSEQDQKLMKLFQEILQDPYRIAILGIQFREASCSPRRIWFCLAIQHIFNPIGWIYSAVGSHSRFLIDFKKIAGVVYWRGMKKDIWWYIAACEICQRNKYEASSLWVCYNPY